MTITISSMPFSIASNTASLVKAGGTVTTEPLIGAPWCSTACSTVSNTGTPWTSRPLRPGRDAAHDLRALAVVEALAREVHGLAAGDALDDEGGVLVDQDDITPATPWIFSTARRAASCIDTERSQYSTPYFSRILKPSSSQAPGMRKMAIFSAGS